MKNWTWTGWWNEDTRGVVKIVAALILLAAVGWGLFGCTAYTPARLELGLAREMGGSPVVGSDPVGMARIVQPITPWLSLEYLHLSSVPDVRDRETVDQVGLTVTIPLGPVAR
jgi:hypothetical protein